jgi:proline dehydrogenase
LRIKEALLFKIAKRWISGTAMNDALEAAKSVNGRGMGAILNYLGEEVTDQSRAEKHAGEYLKLQRALSGVGIDGCVSIKLTQFGLSVNERFAADRAELLASEAEKLNQLLWIDMESSKFTDKTQDIYLDLLSRHSNVGIAIQAYMRRSESDLHNLITKGARVRLVKGAYNEPADLIYKSRSEVRKNYLKFMKILFEKSDNFAIATHDSTLIDEAKRLAKLHRVHFEFEMLRGVREDLKKELVRSGYRTVDYIPYGDEWYSYSIRRIREHPSNIWLLIRSLF